MTPLQPLIPPVQGPGVKVPEARFCLVYEVATGRIFQAGHFIREEIAAVQGRAVLETYGTVDGHFVRDGIVFLRTPLEVEIEGRTVRGLPPGTWIMPVGHPTIEASGEWIAPVELGPSVTVTLDHPAHKPKTIELRDYRADRQDAYLSAMRLGDQLDAAAKGFKALREAGVELPSETAAWLDMIEAVKAEIPKD